MLTFVTSGDHQYTVRDVLETRATPFTGGVHILSYRDFLRFRSLPLSNYVFLDLERLSTEVIDATRERLVKIIEAYPEIEVLNMPRAELTRLAVMSRLHSMGLNRFRVTPASRPFDDLIFPVFLRKLDDHNGPLTPQLRSSGELRAALNAMSANGPLDEALAITEYVDTRNSDGFFEKRSYFRVGSTYFPGALNYGTHWVCKGVAGLDESPVQRHLRRDFLEGNSDEELIRPFFEATGTTYGRADYAIVDGRPQVFEINTNPMIVPPERLDRDDRQFAAIILRRWMAALADFAPQNKSRHVWVEAGPPPDVELPGPGGHIMRRLTHRALAATKLLHLETALMRPLRVLRIAR